MEVMEAPSQVTQATLAFNVSRETLLEPLQRVIGVVERKHQFPVLSHVLFTVGAHQLTISATDMEVELSTTITLTEVAEVGSITVPARKLIDIVRALPDETNLSFAIKDGVCLLKAGKGRRYKLLTLPAEQFPLVDAIEPSAEMTLPASELLGLMEGTAFSMANQDVRFYLNGLLLQIEKGKLSAVATDGHRLAVCHALDESLSDVTPVQLILPRKGVNELMRLLDGLGEDKVRLSMTATHIKIEGESFAFISKLIEGKYPDYRGVIPKNTSIKIGLNRDDLKSALSRASILASDKYHGVRLAFLPEAVQITCDNPEQEHAEESLGYASGEAPEDPLEVGFNVHYLLDVLNSLPPGEVLFSLTDASSSMQINTPLDEQSLYVVMPLRI